MWVCEQHTVPEYAMSTQRSESVFKMWKEAEVPGEKNQGNLRGPDKPKQDIHVAHAIFAFYVF